MPELAGKAGHDIVTSSGDTLLGADDKAGVAEIMAAVAHLAAHPELPRPTLRDRLHARRGDRPGRDALRRRALRRALRLHDGRLDRRRAPGRDLHRRRGDRSRSTASTSTRASRPASSSTPRGSPARMVAALPAGPPHARDDRRPRGLHPRLRGRPATAGTARRSARSCATSTTTCSPATSRCCARTARGGRRRRAARAAARSTCADQYPNMRTPPRAVPRGRRGGRARDPRRGDRAAARRRSAAAPTARC